MENLPLPEEKKLSSPHEKLLRSPTFWEKQGKLAKWLAIGSIIVFILLSASAMLLKSQKSTIIPIQPAQPPISTTPAINAIEISTDQKSILNAQTKEVIFTIENAKNYLKNSGYEYNADTFQTTNAKYEGDCFIDAALSNKKDKIAFSTGCLPGDLPQAWTGVYKNYNDYCPPNAKCEFIPKENRIKFIIGGGGKNFIWSPDDATITYEADLGLSGLTETRTIDSNTGQILENKNSSASPNPETANWKTYRNEKYGFELHYPSTEWFLTSNITDGILSQTKTAVRSLDTVNLYTQRSGNPETDELSTTITFSVYTKDENLTILQWLTSAIPDMPKVKKGDLSIALQQANSSKTGLLTYKESSEGNVKISEFGIVGLPGYFDYATYFHKKNSQYVYSIELRMPLRYDPIPSDPDEKYTNIYNQILSTFKFLDQTPS